MWTSGWSTPTRPAVEHFGVAVRGLFRFGIERYRESLLVVDARQTEHVDHASDSEARNSVSRTRPASLIEEIMRHSNRLSTLAFLMRSECGPSVEKC